MKHPTKKRTPSSSASTPRKRRHAQRSLDSVPSPDSASTEMGFSSLRTSWTRTTGRRASSAGGRRPKESNDPPLVTPRGLHMAMEFDLETSSDWNREQARRELARSLDGELTHD